MTAGASCVVIVQLADSASGSAILAMQSADALHD
jgi:hypothetical protein